MGNPELTPGSLFASRFEIEPPAIRGGMGTVYRARDRYSGETVALKLLHPGSGRPDEVARFAREAQLLSELRHPGIVVHIAHGQTIDGQRFLAMEWLDGQDLSQRLSRGPLPVRDCLRLIAQVADALSFAHGRGVIHRDLKPSNLFLIGGDIERVKIIDFGIARRIGNPQTGPAPLGSQRRMPTMTQTGMVIGTPEYMAPEQARGSRDLTPAADLFSLGCVLYESLTGDPPFVADHIAAVLVRILFEEPIAIERRRPGISPALSALLGRLLAKEPSRRGTDAAALRAELLRLGELPEPAVAATMVGPQPQAENFAAQEQSLFSIVLAAPAAEEIGHGATLPAGAAHLMAADRQALRQSLAALGGTADWLADGSLVVTVPPLGSAQDQATVAARAALLIKQKWPLARLAMATGRGAVRGHAAVGEVVDTAARLLRSSDRSMSAAATAGVLMDLLSAQLLAGRFALSTQPDGAIRLHAELDEDASRPLLGKPTPCVGREVELGHLEAQLAACIEESEARAMLLTAPPGAGKSRLRHEFLRRVQKQSQPLTVLLGRGDILSAGAPYGILRAALHKLCGICGSEPLDTQRARLQTRIGRHVTPLHAERIVLFIGELCNVPFPKEGKPMLQAAHQDPKIMRECLRRAFLDFLAAEGAAAPVLLVLDDLQWADPLTVSVLDAALRELAGAPLFVLAFARPELHGTFPKLWKGHTVQELQLKGLSKKACERLITQVLGKEVLPDVIASAIEQSAGNALFLEEIIRSIAEGKAASQVETVVAMLQARLGRLDGNLRKTVRAAAIFGQTFWRAGVAALLGLAEEAPELDVWLPALVDAEVAEPHPQSRLANQSEYRFRHALVRDAAYSLLTTSDQQTGHRLAGRFLESAGESDTAAIADHFERGADCQSAVRWYRRAVAQAIRSGDYDSAIHLGDRAISLGASGDDLATIRILQALAYYWTGRHFIGERCAREVVLQQPAGSELRYYAVCMAVMGASQIGLFDDYRAEVEDFLAFTPPAEGARRHLYRLAILPFTLFCISEYRLITDILARLDGLSHVVPSDPVRHAYRVYMQANVHFYLDADPWKAVALDRQALSLFEQLGDLSMVHTTRGVLALHALGLGDVEAAAPLWREALENRDVSSISTESWFHYARLLYLAQTENFSEVPAAGTAAMDRLSTVDSLVVRCPSMIALAYALSGMNELAQAEHWARAAVALTQRLPGLRCFALAVLARALVNQHRPAEALAAAREARALLLQHGPPYDREPLVHLAFAEALYASGEVGAARAAIAEAMERLLRRAAAIPNQADQQRFFANVPEHARTQELHRRWLGTESSR